MSLCLDIVGVTKVKEKCSGLEMGGDSWMIKQSKEIAKEVMTDSVCGFGVHVQMTELAIGRARTAMATFSNVAKARRFRGVGNTRGWIIYAGGSQRRCGRANKMIQGPEGNVVD